MSKLATRSSQNGVVVTSAAGGKTRKGGKMSGSSPDVVAALKKDSSQNVVPESFLPSVVNVQPMESESGQIQGASDINDTLYSQSKDIQQKPSLKSKRKDFVSPLQRSNRYEDSDLQFAGQSLQEDSMRLAYEKSNFAPGYERRNQHRTTTNSGFSLNNQPELTESQK